MKHTEVDVYSRNHSYVRCKLYGSLAFINWNK